MPPRAGWWKPIVWAAAVALVVVAMGLFGRAEPPLAPDEPPATPGPVSLGAEDAVVPPPPVAAAITIDIAQALARKGDLAGAERAYRAAIAREPDSAVAHAGLGRVLLALGRPRTAAREFRRAARLAPHDPGPRIDLAIAEAQRQHPRRSRPLFQMALRAAGVDPGAEPTDLPDALADRRIR